jgi:hypothetical protein
MRHHLVEHACGLADLVIAFDLQATRRSPSPLAIARKPATIASNHQMKASSGMLTPMAASRILMRWALIAASTSSSETYMLTTPSTAPSGA